MNRFIFHVLLQVQEAENLNLKISFFLKRDLAEQQKLC